MYRFTRIAAAALTAGVLSVGLVGCTEHGYHAIPAQAETLTSGRGGDLIQARAPHNGKMYVLDATDNKLVWSGKVKTDDRVNVDPTAGVVKLNGDTVTDARLNRDHKYSIQYWRP